MSEIEEAASLQAELNLLRSRRQEQRRRALVLLEDRILALSMALERVPGRRWIRRWRMRRMLRRLIRSYRALGPWHVR